MNQKTVVRMGYGRSYDMGVFGSNFGHAVTQNLPVLASQFVQGPTSNFTRAFQLDAGPPTFNFPAIPSNGLLPVAGPQCFQASSVVIDTTTELQSCTQPHIRPTYQRLPTLDAWNVTVQRQLANTTSLEVALYRKQRNERIRRRRKYLQRQSAFDCGLWNGDPDSAAAALQPVYIFRLPRSQQHIRVFDVLLHRSRKLPGQ